VKSRLEKGREKRGKKKYEPRENDPLPNFLENVKMCKHGWATLLDTLFYQKEQFFQVRQISATQSPALWAK
jgi:hypothetical protein